MPSVVNCDLHGEVSEMGEILTLSSSCYWPISFQKRSPILLMASVGNSEPIKDIRQSHSPRNIPELARPSSVHRVLTAGVGPVTSELSGLADSGPWSPQRASDQGLSEKWA
ncbi:hypothetical protein P7K49_024544 [Saguinus oedipus]|uniref:Uncharacterized protein n=1 Tax=Saguinus oedipus TaxID=9490 RepID=A0ABQ9UPU2_SAGOE|nr:hypothetical protein P7K49_024544 [Saguinus oedipus]